MGHTTPLSIHELGKIGSEETIGLLISMLKDNIKNKTGYQTQTTHLESDPTTTGGITRSWMGVPSENRTIIEILTQHHVEEVIALATQAVTIIPEEEDQQEALHIAYVIYEAFGEILVYPQNDTLIPFEPTPQQRLKNELLKNFKHEWLRNFDNLNDAKKNLGQTVTAWFDLYEQDRTLVDYTIDASPPEDTIHYFRTTFSNQQLETYTLFGSLASLDGQATRLSLTHQYNDGYWRADFTSDEGHLLWLICIPTNPHGLVTPAY